MSLIIPALPLVVSFPGFPDRPQEPFAPPVVFITHQCLHVVSPSKVGAGEMGLLILYHSISDPGLFTLFTRNIHWQHLKPFRNQHSGNAVPFSYKTSPTNLGNPSLAVPSTGLIEDRFLPVLPYGCSPAALFILFYFFF